MFTNDLRFRSAITIKNPMIFEEFEANPQIKIQIQVNCNSYKSNHDNY